MTNNRGETSLNDALLRLTNWINYHHGRLICHERWSRFVQSPSQNPL